MTTLAPGTDHVVMALLTASSTARGSGGFAAATSGKQRATMRTKRIVFIAEEAQSRYFFSDFTGVSFHSSKRGENGSEDVEAAKRPIFTLLFQVANSLT